MKLKALGCYGGNIPGHGMTSFLVNDSLALDAGWVSNALSLKEQDAMRWAPSTRLGTLTHDA